MEEGLNDFYFLFQHEVPIEIYEFNPNNEELEEENPLKMVPFLIDGHVKVWGRYVCKV